MQHIGRRLAGRTVERIHRQLGDRVLAALHVFPGGRDSIEAVLGRVKRHQTDRARAGEDFPGLDSVRVDAGVIGHQPDAFALQEREAIFFENIDAELHLSARRHRGDRKEESEHNGGKPRDFQLIGNHKPLGFALYGAF